jgi:hypothetical protein
VVWLYDDIPFMSCKINQDVVFCLNQVTSNHRFLEAFCLPEAQICGYGTREIQFLAHKKKRRRRKELISATCFKSTEQIGHIDFT